MRFCFIVVSIIPVFGIWNFRQAHRPKVHAQRKFAQGSRPESPSVSPLKKKHTPKKFFTTKKAKTEDFLTFLCLRGQSSLCDISTNVNLYLFLAPRGSTVCTFVGIKQQTKNNQLQRQKKCTECPSSALRVGKMYKDYLTYLLGQLCYS